MKKLIFLPLIGVLAMLGISASPKSSSTYSCVWTNDGTFVYLVGQGSVNVNGAVAGPSFVLQTNYGSVFAGKYVGQDTSLPNNNAVFFPNSFTMVSSNEPSGWAGRWAAADSEDYNFYSTAIITGNADKDSSYAFLQLQTGTTNGNSGQIILRSVPNSPTVEALTIYQNGTEKFKIGQDGTIIFVGSSSPPVDTVNVQAWVSVRIGTQTYKLPLFQ